MSRNTRRVPTGSVYRDKARGGWVASFRWKDRDIARRWRTRTKAEADDALEAFRSDLVAGLDPRTVPFRTVADDYLTNLARTGKPSSVDFARWGLRHAVEVIGDVPVADLRGSHVEAVMSAAEDKGLSPRSVRAIRGRVRAVLQRAVRDRLIGSNPADLVRGPKTEKRTLRLPPVADVLALLDSMREERHPSWPVLWVIASGALRTGEARSLRWSDVHRAEDIVTVAGQLARDGTWSTPKTEAGVRDVPITQRMSIALDEATARRDHNGIASVYVFAGSDGQPPAAWTTYKAWTRAQEKAWGEVRITVHGLRHLALSALITAEGVSLADAAAYAGHSDSRILAETYAHALANHRDRVRRALEEGGVG